MNFVRQEHIGFTEAELIKIAFDIVNALAYLNKNYLVEVGTIEPSQISFDMLGNAKLQGYGIKYLNPRLLNPTAQTNPLNFLYTAPEYFLLPPSETDQFDFMFKSEIWSLGIILLSCLNSPFSALRSYFLNSGNDLSPEKAKIDFPKFITDYLKLVPKYLNFSVFSKFPFLTNFDSELERWLFGLDINEVSVQFRDFLSKCLEVNIERRCDANMLLNHPVFRHLTYGNKKFEQPTNILVYRAKLPFEGINHFNIEKEKMKELLTTKKGIADNNAQLFFNYMTWNGLYYLFKYFQKQFKFEDFVSSPLIGGATAQKKPVSKVFTASLMNIIKFVTNQLNLFCGVNTESAPLEEVSQIKHSHSTSANSDTVSNSDTSSVISFLPKQISAIFVSTSLLILSEV